MSDLIKLDPKRDYNGGANSPFNYDLHCPCGALLGPLGVFSEKEGKRHAHCTKCHTTLEVKGKEVYGFPRPKGPCPFCDPNPKPVLLGAHRG